MRRAITPTLQDKINADQRQVNSREPTTETQVTAITSISRMTDIAAMFNTESRAASLANDYHALAYSGALGDGTLYPSSNRPSSVILILILSTKAIPLQFERSWMTTRMKSSFSRAPSLVPTGLEDGTRAITAILVDERAIYNDDGDNIESATEGDYIQRVWRQNEEHDNRECYQPICLFQVIARGYRMMIPREKADDMDKRLGIDRTVLPDDEAPERDFIGFSAITLHRLSGPFLSRRTRRVCAIACEG